MQNDAALMAYIRAHRVRLAAHGRLRGYSPRLDELARPYSTTDAADAEALALLAPPGAAEWCYAWRRAAVALCGLCGGAVVWAACSQCGLHY